MRITFAGSGDAFGSAARFNTCIHVAADRHTFLIDCGATGLVALKARQLDPGSVDTIVISHLHGDHFAGVPFFLLHARLVDRRRRPLTVTGPPGLADRLRQAMEILFPGSAAAELGFDLRVVELPTTGHATISGIDVATAEVCHPSGAPSLALRLTCDRRIIAYSGDTAWVDQLVAISDGADLFICECYMYDRRVPFHLDHATLCERRGQLRPRRMVLTHMSEAMLARAADAEFELAFDGMVIEL